MSGKLSKSGYQKLIDEDIAWLKARAPDTLERQHIILVLESSVDTYYPPKINCPECKKLIYKHEYDCGVHQMTECNGRPEDQDGGDHK